MLEDILGSPTESSMTAGTRPDLELADLFIAEAVFFIVKKWHE
jgi:hypothetical protein